MVEPLSMLAASLGIAVSGITIVQKFLLIVQELKTAPEGSKVFVRILDQVNRDMNHAVECYDEVKVSRRDHPIQNRWIQEALEATIYEINDFGYFVRDFDQSRSVDLKSRVKYIMQNYKALSDREKALSFAHGRLLTAIGTMHNMTLQPGSAISRSLSPMPTEPSRRRASRAPPSDSADDSMDGVAPVSTLRGSTGESMEGLVISAV
ncbi:hypothetical protein M426DRAFT_27819 [Hypoxylon sp. CI-4A]|nr:hypothetical protein M426DRAFT_27819 [Hypoxylon sp. CI-4A]